METIIVSVLFVYGLSTILVDTDGPSGFIYKLRQRFIVFKCFICTSFWISAFTSAVTYDSVISFLYHTFVIVGGSIILYRLSNN